MYQLDKIDDVELVYRINKYEDKYAYQELFERYAPKIYRFALSYLNNSADAEEIIQIVFLKIWEKRKFLDKSKNIKAFIYKIAINHIYDFIRHKNIVDAFSEYINTTRETHTNSTWHEVIFEDMQLIISNFIAQMPEQRRKVFQLSKINGLSNDEIVKELNISKRTVENHLYRAVLYLKEQLNEGKIIH